MEQRPDAEQPTDWAGSLLANREEMERLDREARQLVRDSLPLLDAGRRAEAAEMAERAAELMQSVADLMERNRREIMAQIAVLRARPGQANPAEPGAAADRGLIGGSHRSAPTGRGC